jgi:hypothetical protein
LKDRVLHYKPEKTTAIINACIVLHNMCTEYNISEVMDETIDEFDLTMYHNQEPLYEHVNDIVQSFKLQNCCFEELNRKVLKLCKNFRYRLLINQKKVAIPPRSGSVRHLGFYVRFFSFF